ncbi:hypothetical protein BDQ17DRAFT_1363754 [Cyathus striatus]|nr:hypothetical protein BDQ17DRAFT_1380169 [Cyathus striatus]KAF8996983.1 hypothetical protein BDQ17DRAFT_1363754 [Cyathus striatus]
MYEKGAGKGGNHNWVSSSTNIGAISYIGMQVWRQLRPGHRHFHGLFGPTAKLGLPRFAHIPATAFLCEISPTSIQPVPQNDSIVEMRGDMFTQTYIGISEQKELALSAAKCLKTRQKHSNVNTMDNN